jgi:hypothetical protein
MENFMLKTASRLRGAVVRVVGTVGTAFLAMMVYTQCAFAANGFGEVFGEDVTSQGNELLQGLLSAAFIGGAGFTIFGILHAIKAHKSDGRDAKMPQAVTMILGGAALSTVSFMLGAGQGTIFSNGGTSATSQQTMTIN